MLPGALAFLHFSLVQPSNHHRGISFRAHRNFSAPSMPPSLAGMFHKAEHEHFLCACLQHITWFTLTPPLPAPSGYGGSQQSELLPLLLVFLLTNIKYLSSPGQHLEKEDSPPFPIFLSHLYSPHIRRDELSLLPFSV